MIESPNLRNEKGPGCLGYIYIILPNYVGIRITTIRIPSKQPVQWKVRVSFRS